MTTQTVSNEKDLKVAIRQRMIQVFITILIQALILFGAAAHYVGGRPGPTLAFTWVG